MALPERLLLSGFAVGLAVVPSPVTPGASCMAFSARPPVSGFAVGLAVVPAPVTPGESFISFSARSPPAKVIPVDAKTRRAASVIGFILSSWLCEHDIQTAIGVSNGNPTGNQTACCLPRQLSALLPARHCAVAIDWFVCCYRNQRVPRSLPPRPVTAASTSVVSEIQISFAQSAPNLAIRVARRPGDICADE